MGVTRFALIQAERVLDAEWIEVSDTAYFGGIATPD